MKMFFFWYENGGFYYENGVFYYQNHKKLTKNHKKSRKKSQKITKTPIFTINPPRFFSKNFCEPQVSLGFNQSGDSLLTGSFDHTARIWDVATGVGGSGWVAVAVAVVVVFDGLSNEPKMVENGAILAEIWLF
jgi:WD40 repeat protein